MAARELSPDANAATPQGALPPGWQPIDTAPTSPGAEFLVWQDGEIYHVQMTKPPHSRLAWRTHQNRVSSTQRLIDAEMDGKPVQARVEIEKSERFEHSWCFWTRGFEFAPTGWAALPSDGASSRPLADDQGQVPGDTPISTQSQEDKL